MPAVCDRVFRVPELAEMILVQLPIRDVLVNVQRTSRTWRDIVNGSLVLQQALFMAPIGHKPLHYINPEPHIRGPGKERWAESDRSASVNIVENPVITLALRASSANTLPAACEEAIAYSEASWRRMFVTQPPAAELALTRRTQQGVVREVVKNEAMGIRLRDLNLPLENMREISISGWYMWQICGLSDDCESLRRRITRYRRCV